MNPSVLRATAVAIMAALISTLANAGTVDDRVMSSTRLKVCIWPDDYGLSFRNPRTPQLAGIDIEFSAQLATDLGASVTLVDPSFPTPIEDVASETCDVAMFVIGARVAVQTGTFLAPVTAEALKLANLVVIAPPTTLEAELEAGRVDVAAARHNGLSDIVLAR
jgi:ABC-type amino acid transport substrate-binding protein